MHYSMTVNGQQHDVDVAPGTPLLSVLRNTLGLTGSRFGCGQGVCGACYVLADGRAVASCTLSIDDAAKRNIVTIEGLARDGELHRVQRAFIEHDAMQCGYCTSGMIIAAVALLQRSPAPTEDEVREALAPHLCRCGVYQRAIVAVRSAGR